MGKLILDLYESLWLDENGDLHFVSMNGGRAGANWRLIQRTLTLEANQSKFHRKTGRTTDD